MRPVFERDVLCMVSMNGNGWLNRDVTRHVARLCRLKCESAANATKVTRRNALESAQLERDATAGTRAEIQSA